MTWEFLLFNKKHTHHELFHGDFKISKEVKSLSEFMHKFVTKTFFVKYYFKKIRNPQASKCNRKSTTSQVFHGHIRSS